MANEITVNASLAYEDSENADVLLDVAGLLANVSVKRFVHLKQSIGTSEEAINIGDLSAPGYAIFRNRDSTNYIELKVATGGAIFAKLLPGEVALLRLGSGAQAPYAIANAASCQLEFLIVNT